MGRARPDPHGRAAGAARCQVRPKGAGRPTRALLAGLPRHGRAIFAGEDPATLEAELRPLWRELRKALRRPRFRLHDLRHSAASVGINRGFSLQVIGGLLGHADLDSNAGYAHLDQGRMVAASERVGAHLSRAFARPRTGGAPPPRAARRKTLAAPGPEDYAAFAESGDGLHGFCAARKIDPRLFHAGLKDWQKRGRTTS
ncbi:hypothetical protein EU803_15735 [Loktanella sp. IMCC34160]|uniref:tyrosine-type recombinase/integrase n=1 Tax=Loktanella sp. IMCC34160 TaxID=2510646 RepID=UPI00101CB620|nr:tyrosine-type recombinase/integrase [Loktanella sp. IMCC34160]RYG90062.1 hypothetical protein EU803_15735 [Loktanella sp. IMCC34160]